MAPPVLTERQHFPVIANLVVGVGSNQEYIADLIAPGIDTEGGFEFEYDLVDNSAVVPANPAEAKRGLKAPTRTITQPEESTKKDEVVEWALNAETDINEIEGDRARDRANPVPAGRMSHEERRYKRLAGKLYSNLKILKEQATAAKVFHLSGYDAALRNPNPVNFAGEADIVTMMLDLARDVDRRWLHPIDTLILGWDSMISLLKNDAIRDLISGGATIENPALADLKLLAKAFHIPQVVLGKAVAQTQAVPGAPGVPTDLWKPNAAAMIHTGMDGFDEEGDPDFDMHDESTSAFVKRFYRNVPQEIGGGPLSVMAYYSLNGKIRYLEATEYWKLVQVSQCGYYWDNTNAT
jgi:hypothetical protein